MTVLPYLVDHYYDIEEDALEEQYLTEHELNGEKICVFFNLMFFRTGFVHFWMSSFSNIWIIFISIFIFLFFSFLLFRIPLIKPIILQIKISKLALQDNMWRKHFLKSLIVFTFLCMFVFYMH